jgi:hypothetical protein
VIGRSDDAGSQRSMAKEEMMFCLQTHEQHAVVSVQPAVLAFGINNDSRAECVKEGVAGLRAGHRQQPAVIAFQPGNLSRRAGADPSTDTFPTPSAYTNGDQAPHVLAFHHTQDPISGSVSPSLGVTTDGMGVFCTTGHVTHALTAEGGSEDETGRGTPIVVKTLPASLGYSATGHNKDELIIVAHGQANAVMSHDIAPTLTTLHDAPYLVHPTLNTTHFGKHFGCNQHVAELGVILPAIGRPRRLTPLECERLMSWPDGWTAHGVREDGTQYALSDTARYRLCGNGVGSVVAAWIARRLVWAETHTPTAATGRVEAR